MTIDFSNLNILWGSLLIEELIRNGVDYFVISPGSRSSPLTVAVARNAQAKSIVCFDERGAAFHALGYALATNKCTVLICTSGSAAANYFPAIIEASVKTVPILILSGDRPPELRQTGANQTIQQFNLFGAYVRWQFDLPCPDEKISPSMVLTTADQAVYQALRSPRGPVHINCMFREPLAPLHGEITENYLASLSRWQQSSRPYTSYVASSLEVAPVDMAEIARIINQTQKGVIAIGDLKSKADREAVLALAAKLNWPVFADIQSGLRLSQGKNLIHYGDQLLLGDALKEIEPVETVLQFGNCLVSKRFLEFVEKQPNLNYLMVLEQPFRDDPSHKVSMRIEANIAQFWDAIEPMLDDQVNDYSDNLISKSQFIGQVIDDFLLTKSTLDEPTIARVITGAIPAGNGLFLASSMPIRDVDMYGTTRIDEVFVGANRGTSGIEGTIASASGFAVGLQKPVTLLIGDLAFIHDLNSLTLLKSLDFPLIIVVVNNDGGGIFSFLPIANFSEVFERYFGTSHQLKFASIAEMFSIKYYHPASVKSLKDCYHEALISQRSAIIEITTDRQDNLELHQQLQEKIIRCLREYKLS